MLVIHEVNSYSILIDGELMATYIVVDDEVLFEVDTMSIEQLDATLAEIKKIKETK